MSTDPQGAPPAVVPTPSNANGKELSKAMPKNGQTPDKGNPFQEDCRDDKPKNPINWEKANFWLNVVLGVMVALGLILTWLMYEHDTHAATSCASSLAAFMLPVGVRKSAPTPEGMGASFWLPLIAFRKDFPALAAIEVGAQEAKEDTTLT